MPKQMSVQCKFCSNRFSERSFIRHAAHGCESNPQRCTQNYNKKSFDSKKVLPAKKDAVKTISTRKYFAAPGISTRIESNTSCPIHRAQLEKTAKEINEKILKPMLAACRARREQKRKRSDSANDDEAKPKKSLKLSNVARNARLARFSNNK